ncbi:hypothetical protein [Sphingopyxis sp. SE2]|uniref:hypothetical protein n=1 Tax=Sphingopyxis sp. SE2 TaxID=1586240 RepID=UPI0028C3BAA0|nr:hypothetical protein [Sphingopyxis sp. SE2]
MIFVRPAVISSSAASPTNSSSSRRSARRGAIDRMIDAAEIVSDTIARAPMKRQRRQIVRRPPTTDIAATH